MASSSSKKSKRRALMDSSSSDSDSDSDDSLAFFHWKAYTTSQKGSYTKPTQVPPASSPYHFQLTRIKATTTPGKKRPDEKKPFSKERQQRITKIKTNLLLHSDNSSEDDDLLLPKSSAIQKQRLVARKNIEDSDSDVSILQSTRSSFRPTANKTANDRKTRPAAQTNSDDDSTLLLRTTTTHSAFTHSQNNDHDDSDSVDTAELMKMVKQANQSLQAKNKTDSPRQQQQQQDIPPTVVMQRTQQRKDQPNLDGSEDDNDDSTYADSAPTGPNKLDSSSEAPQQQPPAHAPQDEEIPQPGDIPSVRTDSPVQFELPEQLDSSVSSSDSDEESDIVDEKEIGENETTEPSQHNHTTNKSPPTLQQPLTDVFHHNHTTIDTQHHSPPQSKQQSYSFLDHDHVTQRPKRKNAPVATNASTEAYKRDRPNAFNAAFDDMRADVATTSSTKDAEVIDLSGDNPDPRMLRRELPRQSRMQSLLAKSRSYNVAARSFLNTSNNTGWRSQGHNLESTDYDDGDNFGRKPAHRRVTDEHSHLAEPRAFLQDQIAHRNTPQSVPKIPNPWESSKRTRRIRDPSGSNLALATSVVPSKRKQQTYQEFEIRTNPQAKEPRTTRDADIRRFMQRPQLVNANVREVKEGIRSTRHDIEGHAEVTIVNPPPLAGTSRRNRKQPNEDDDIVEILNDDFEPMAPPSRTSRAASGSRRTKRTRSTSQTKKNAGGRRGGNRRWGGGRGRDRGKGFSSRGGGRRGRNTDGNGAWGGEGAWEPSPQFQRQEDPAFEGFGAEVTF